MTLNLSDLLRVSVFLIPILISILFINPNIVTFFTSSKSERLLLNKELRHLYNIIIFSVTLILCPIILTSESVKNSGKVYIFFMEHADLFVYIAILGFFLSLYLLNNYKKIKVYKDRFRLGVLGALLTCTYIPLTATTYGIILNDLFLVNGSVPLKIFYCGILTFLYFVILKPLLETINNIGHQEIKAIIKLKGGTTIKNAYILHPTYGKRILLGDNPNPNDCERQFAVTLKEIEYIEFEIKNIIKDGSGGSSNIIVSTPNEFKTSKKRLIT